MKENIKFELIPDSCMGISLKNGLKPKDWSILRKKAYEKCNKKCTCCGKKLEKFEAHEVWSYDQKTITRKLENIICVCSLCHKAIHMNRSLICENADEVENHYMKINDCSYSEMKQQLGKANEKQKELSKIYDWKLDLTVLEDFIK